MESFYLRKRLVSGRFGYVATIGTFGAAALTVQHTSMLSRALPMSRDFAGMLMKELRRNRRVNQSDPSEYELITLAHRPPRTGRVAPRRTFKVGDQVTCNGNPEGFIQKIDGDQYTIRLWQGLRLVGYVVVDYADLVRENTKS